MKNLRFCLIFIVFVGCTPKNIGSEYQDEIYKDLLIELDIAKKAVEAEEKYLLSLEAEKSQVVPQTGQIKFVNKKISDSIEKLSILKQQKQYFELKIDSRLQYARDRLAESQREGGRPWPDNEEISAYKAVAKFQRDKLEYERTKKLSSSKKAVPRGTKSSEKEAAQK